MSLTTRGTVTSQMQKWDTGTLAWVPWDGSVTGATGGGTGGADVQYVEDAVAPLNPTGMALAMVRADGLSSIVTNDGDIMIARGNANGELYVTDGTNGATLGNISTDTANISFATGTINANVQLLTQPLGGAPGAAGVQVLAQRNDTPANVSAFDGSNEQLQMSAGRLWTSTTVTGTVPLPTGAATSALQTTGNTSLASINTKLAPQVATGNISGTTPIVMVFNQPSPSTVVFINDAGHAITMNISLQGSMDGVTYNTLWFEKVSTSSGGYSASEATGDIASTVALQDWGQYVVSTGGMTHFRINPYNNPGGETQAYRIVAYPFSIARNAVYLAGSSGSIVPASSNDKSLNVNLNTGTQPIAYGAGGEGGSNTLRVSIADGNPPIGSVTETAPATDIASSGLNGRLQRIAQRLTTMIASLPAALGQTTMANSSPVVIASDQTTLPVSLPAQSLFTHSFTTTGATWDVAVGGASVAIATFTGSAGVGSPNVSFKGSVDGTTFQFLAATREQSGIASTVTSFNTTTDSFATLIFTIPCEGLQTLRFTSGSTYSSSTVNVQVGLSQGQLHRSFVEARQGPGNTAVANSWFTKLVDWNNVATATVKAASTAAAATDPALVVRSIQLPAAVGQTTMAASLPVTLASDQSALAVSGPLTDTQIRATALPVSGTVTTSPPANASTNVAQLAGTATSVNSGVKDAGTLRVVLATDQPALTNKLLVTPDSVALPANQSVNVNQFGGTGVTIGQQLAAASLPVILPAATVTTLTPPAAITGFALDATLTGRTQKTQLTDGTRDGTVKAASTLPALTDTALVTTQRDPLPAGTNVIGHVINDSGSTTAVTGNVTVVQPTGSNLHAQLDAGAAVIGSLVANQSVNHAQVNGVTVSTGNGVPDTGTQRVFSAQRRTYSASLLLKTATAAGTGPFFSIAGSGTQTIRVQKVLLSGTVATAAIYGDIVLKKTSTATSGGTATALTKAPHDSNSAAATATVNYYTVLATAGTSVGVVQAQSAVFPLTGTVAAQMAQLSFLDMNRDPVEAIVLRGTGQCLEMSFGTTPTNAPTLLVSVTWTEE